MHILTIQITWVYLGKAIGVRVLWCNHSKGSNNSSSNRLAITWMQVIIITLQHVDKISLSNSNMLTIHLMTWWGEPSTIHPGIKMDFNSNKRITWIAINIYNSSSSNIHMKIIVITMQLLELVSIRNHLPVGMLTSRNNNNNNNNSSNNNDWQWMTFIKVDIITTTQVMLTGSNNNNTNN